ncbi:NAD-dependent epimerase/dehydratase family protein [Amnibacterium flavum]|uniref:Short-chain dehydrogenase n=1 Tax=Amnibacterium flavum TaxID=2173173 RepID=A0A2V1HVR2_9MICO|nr:NAD-dependent epimerase/dehydratase family protein [Amnibacterium flavum]PVZ95189.1 short-chain dehydrogenase [Amnibacterium flavum]
MSGQKRILVLGASGTVGSAAARRFLDDDGYEVVAVSRRLPDYAPHDRLRHVAVDLTDADAVVEALGSVGPITHVAYAALFEKPSLISGWTDPEQRITNGLMFENVLAGIAGSPVEHVSLLQGTKAYGYHVGRMPVPAKESQPRVEHPNFYWLQEDALTAAATERGFGYTIWRPQAIFGDRIGVAMNMVPVIGAYAAIRAELGEPFSFTGGHRYPVEAVDARLIGSAMHWAAEAPAARDQTFNITNGDVIAWADIWPAFAGMLDVETGPDERMSLAEWLPQHADVWDRVVERHGLRPNTLAQLLGYSHEFADDMLAWTPDGSIHEARSVPLFLSTIKLRQAGFTEVIDTEEMFADLFGSLRARKILP